MTEGPAVRAGWSKLAIGFVKRLPEEPAKAILDRVGEVRHRVRDASFRDYLALEDFVAIATVTVDVLGAPRARVLWREIMSEALRQPAVGELVRRAGVGNRDPIPLLERTTDAFRYVHRACGDWTVRGDPATKSALVTLERAPRPTIDAPAMQVVYGSNLAAAVVSLGLEPQVFPAVEANARRLRFKVRW
jgi:hypothetical protein